MNETWGVFFCLFVGFNIEKIITNRKQINSACGDAKRNQPVEKFPGLVNCTRPCLNSKRRCKSFFFPSLYSVRATVPHFCQIIMYSIEDIPFPSKSRPQTCVFLMTANQRPSLSSSPGTEPEIRHLPRSAALPVNKNMQNCRSRLLKGKKKKEEEALFSKYHSQIKILFIKQFHKNGAFTFIGMLALKAW